MTEVLDPVRLDLEPSLEDLAKTANCEHAAAQEAAAAAVQHAIAAGEALFAARSRTPAGEWTSWCAANLELSSTTVQNYIRIARFKEIVLEANVSTVVQARQLLVGLPDAVPRGRGAASEEFTERARQLRADGLTYKAIAELFGTTTGAIYAWIHPDKTRESVRNSARRTRERARLVAEAEKGRAIKRALKNADQALAESYALAERMQDVLGQAHRNMSDHEAREALSLAGEHYRKMRDEIVRALGVG